MALCARDGATLWFFSGTEMAYSLFCTKKTTGTWKTASKFSASWKSPSLVAPSPIVELNHAVAIGMAFGPAVGLELVDELLDEPALKDYHLLPSVRGDLLAKLGRHVEARAEFERAAGMTRNERERKLLLDRAAGC